MIKYLYFTLLNQYVAISGSTFTFCAGLNLFWGGGSNSAGYLNSCDNSNFKLDTYTSHY